MRVAIDATSLLGTRTGIGTVTAEIVEALGERDDIDLTLFAATWRGRGMLRRLSPPSAKVVTRPMAARPLRIAWQRFDQPPIEWWTGPIDVVHGPNFVVPPSRRAARVVSVHDLTCVRHPEMCTPDTLTYPVFVRRAVARGAWVHTVSESMAEEIRTSFVVDPQRVVVIANGIGLPPGGKASVGRHIAGGDRYLLGLGTIEPRKDFPTLVRAFDLLAADDPDLRLVIAGPVGWGADALDRAVAAARHRNRIVRPGWVSDDERGGLLRGAAVFAFPSIYEGFGLPPLEAMQVGTPVVVTATGALPETVGDAARLVDVGDPQSLAGGLAEVLNDPALADGLVARGYRNVERFSWPRTVDSLVDLYRRAATGRG